QKSRVTVLGLTFKQDVPDLRNSLVAQVIRELASYDVTVQVHDAFADAEEALHEYGVKLMSMEQMQLAQAVVLAVPHQAYGEAGGAAGRSSERCWRRAGVGWQMCGGSERPVTRPPVLPTGGCSCAVCHAHAVHRQSRSVLRVARHAAHGRHARAGVPARWPGG